ncbi:MAG: hypothetical protein FDZ70_02315 [Actinobacteria bacterium]|nr:MAG: hypothetical protein FDZ70_02315 [Actinomycetota bacterium]
MRLGTRLPVILATIALTSAAAGCGARVTYTQEAEPLTLSEVESRAASFDQSRWSATASERAAELRTRSLASLRLRDETATLLADLLTAEFHASRGVPVQISETVIDGTPAWTVVEVYGPAGGSLDRRRLWVLSRPDGDVISSSTYR